MTEQGSATAGAASMSMPTRISKALGVVGLAARGVGSFLTDRRGVAAVEFAFIAPVLLSLYFVTMEVSQAIETNKKVGRIASMTGDLVAQQQSITKSGVDAIMQIGGSILQPYNRSSPTITVTAIRISDDTTPKVTVDWSRKYSSSGFSQAAAKGSTTTVPSQLKIKGTYLIRVQSSLAYKPVITWAAEDKPALGLTAAFDGISMSETYYLRPRMSQEVSCTDC